MSIKVILNEIPITASFLSPLSQSSQFLSRYNKHIQSTTEALTSTTTLSLQTFNNNENNKDTNDLTKSSYSSSSTSSYFNNDEKNEEQLQVLSFNDPKSKRKIVLIGCMHYNPASISKVKQITSQFGPSNSLHSILIESCPTRWNASKDFINSTLQKHPWQQKLYKKLFNNEMTTASNIALDEYNIPVILGDQAIEITGDRVQYYFKKTVRDVLNPINGGWGYILMDIQLAYNSIIHSFGLSPDQQQQQLKEKNYITLEDYLDIKLLSNMPLSLIRYPLSIIVRNITSICAILLTISLWQNVQLLYFGDGNGDVFGIMNTLLSSTTASASTIDNNNILFIPTATSSIIDSTYSNNDTIELIQDLIGTIGLITAEVIFFLRIFVLPILYERDQAIADMITSVAGNDRLVVSNNKDGDDEDKVLVAVLGMAHCNGVRDIIVNRKE